MIDSRNWIGYFHIKENCHFYLRYLHSETTYIYPFPGKLEVNSYTNYIDILLFEYLNLSVGLNVLPTISINIEDKIYEFNFSIQDINVFAFRKFTIVV